MTIGEVIDAVYREILHLHRQDLREFYEVIQDSNGTYKNILLIRRKSNDAEEYIVIPERHKDDNFIPVIEFNRLWKILEHYDSKIFASTDNVLTAADMMGGGQKIKQVLEFFSLMEEM